MLGRPHTEILKLPSYWDIRRLGDPACVFQWRHSHGDTGVAETRRLRYPTYSSIGDAACQSPSYYSWLLELRHNLRNDYA
ncbi:hypothetical protein CHUAL_001453 [Chamberlinius hualienensis]